MAPWIGGIVAFGLVMATSLPAWAGSTERVSVDSKGMQANDASFASAISPDGRYVAFTSTATNLVANDIRGGRELFVHDRKTHGTSRVSLGNRGEQANEQSYSPAISTGGRFVAFDSLASNLVKGDTNKLLDIFVRDRKAGTTQRVSVAPDGKQAGGASSAPSISADGRFVGFQSRSTILVAGDTNGVSDAFVHDRKTGRNIRVSVSSTGVQGNGTSFEAVVSGDGRFAVFNSSASNLVAGDTNGKQDIFVHELKTGRTSRVSVGPGGAQSDGHSAEPSISDDGRFVAFGSSAGNLVPGAPGGSDIFVHDRKTGLTTRISSGEGGVAANGQSFEARISANGRFVAFTSNASNLVASDTNGADDIFLHDRQTGTMTRIGLGPTDGQGDGDSRGATLSADGRFVAFNSGGTALVPGDTNGVQDIFVHGR